MLNLVPGLPLDGGRVLKAAVWKVTGNRHRGTIAAGWAGRVCAVLALGYPLLFEIDLGHQSTATDYIVAFVIASSCGAAPPPRWRRRGCGGACRRFGRAPWRAARSP